MLSLSAFSMSFAAPALTGINAHSSTLDLFNMAPPLPTSTLTRQQVVGSNQVPPSTPTNGTFFSMNQPVAGMSWNWPSSTDLNNGERSSTPGTPASFNSTPPVVTIGLDTAGGDSNAAEGFNEQDAGMNEGQGGIPSTGTLSGLGRRQREDEPDLSQAVRTRNAGEHLRQFARDCCIAHSLNQEHTRVMEKFATVRC